MTSNNAAVLGVDIGTSSTKGALVDLDGHLLRSATRTHSPDRPRPGSVEMDQAIWWDEFRAISNELIDGAEIVAVGVSGMGPCTALADAGGAALRPGILYGVDTRAQAQIAALERDLGADEIVKRCAMGLSSQAVGPKIAWVADNEPEVFAKARMLLMPSSLLVHRLTGEYVLDHHSASQSVPLYDTAAGTWFEPWWNTIAGRIDPPRLLWAGDIAGSVTPEAAAVTGLAVGTPVIAGTVDAWAEQVSAGAHRVGDLMLMYGTTMFLIDTVENLVTAPTLWSTVGVYPGTRNLAGGMATSGAITSWLNDLVGGPGFAALTHEAKAAGAGAKGLLLLPYFAGERTPVADPDARGVIAGLTVTHTRGDLYRAALEGTAFGVRHNVEAMRDAGGRVDRVVAVGGGTTGGLWTQIVSDVTDLPQVIPTHTIGASYGAAFLAACAVDTALAPDSIDRWNPPADIVEPDPETAATYQELYRRYRELYPATVDIAHALTALQSTTTR